jgi:hypothetical protein
MKISTVLCGYTVSLFEDLVISFLIKDFGGQVAPCSQFSINLQANSLWVRQIITLRNKDLAKESITWASPFHVKL